MLCRRSISSYFIAVFLALAALCPLPSHAASALSVERTDGKEVVTLTLPAAGGSRIFTLGNPDRLVVDVPALPKDFSLSVPRDYSGTLIKDVRVGRFDPKTSRIVFDLASMPDTIQQHTDNGAHGLRIRITLAFNPDASSTPAKEKKAEAEPPPKKITKKKEDARPIIVIDAGHGGQDPGTIGRGGTQEKSITLDYARTLRKLLLAGGRYRVYMTRDDDRFILLHQRVTIARKLKADLFVSLHADSAPENMAVGLSVYTLSEKASDAEAQALADRENKVDAVYGLDLSDQSKDVADILISLAQRDTNNRSATLAESVVISMDKNTVRLLPNPHRFAGFAVLKAPDIPSVLVETGFLSNPAEEKQLLAKPRREKIMKALAKGIDAYFNTRKTGNGA